MTIRKTCRPKSHRRWLGIATVLALFLSTPVAADEFELAGRVIAQGSRETLSLDVPAGPSDPATTIPVTAIHGAKAGPVLLVVAGVHGYEFAPILAAQALSEAIDAQQLAGTLLIVNVAHVAALEERSPYVNPYDRKNLNRSFPGDAQGSQTQRIAWVLSEQLIKRADFVIDVHSGDGGEWLQAFVGVYGGPMATDFKTALAVGRAFAFRNIVRYSMETQQQIDRGRSLNRQAVAAGVPTILVEIGQNGSREASHVRALTDGLLRSLGVLSMSTLHPSQPTTEFRYLEGGPSVPVAHTGIWSPTQATGRLVRKGEVIGTIKDYWGQLLEAVKAPVDGYALYGLAGPPVKSGDSVMAIGRPVARFEPAP